MSALFYFWESDVSDAVFSLAVFLPDALRDYSDRGVVLVVWEKCQGKRGVGAESEADDAGNGRAGHAVTSDLWREPGLLSCEVSEGCSC